MLRMIYKISIILFILFFKLGAIFAGFYIGNFADLQVRNCLDENTYKQYSLSRKLSYEMSGYNVKERDVETVWELYAIQSNKSEKYMKSVYLSGISVFHLEPFTLKMGDYKVNISTIINNNRKIQGSCFFRIKSEGTMAIIDGGTSRQYSPGDDIVLDGSLSLDLSNTKEKKSLTYKWLCTQINQKGFCQNNVGIASRFVIPGKFATDMEIFKITLVVKNEDGRLSTTYQELVIMPNSSHISISCVDNNPPVVRSPDIRKASLFTVRCEKYCDEHCKFDWLMYKSNDVLVATQGNCSVTSCTFGSRAYKEPGIYKVAYSCVGKTRSRKATIMVTFQKQPIFTCKFNKKIGTSYDIFYLDCAYDIKENIEYFEVYAADKRTGNIGEFITSWSPPFTSKFRITPNVEKIYVRATNTNGTYGESTLYVTVKAFLDINEKVNSQIAKIKGKYFGFDEQSVRYALENKNDVEEAISRIGSIWASIYLTEGTTTLKEYLDFIYNLKLYTIDDLEKIPVTTYDRLTAITTVLQNIILYQTTIKTDTLLARSLTNVCKKLAYDMKRLLEKIQFPIEVAEKTTIISNMLLECGNKNSYENYDLLTPLPITLLPQVNNTMVPFEEAIFENYDNYEDFDEQYYEHLENLMEAASNSIRTHFLVGENTVRTIRHGIEKKLKATEDIKQLVYKHYGYKFKKHFHVDGVGVSPSGDIERFKDTIFLSVIAWKKNIFWFSRSKLSPITYVVNLDLINLETDDNISVKRPHIITLRVIRKSGGTSNIINGTVTVPLAYKTEIVNEDYLDKYINIYKIDLFRYQGLMVEFHALEDRKFNVVVKDSKSSMPPTYRDFKNNFTVFDKNHNSSYYTTDNDRDTRFYVAILPNREMLNDSKQVSLSFPYKITFSAIACYSWSFVDEWTRACKCGIKTNKTHISCECDHLSIVSGFKEPVTSRLITEENFDFEFDIRAHVTIFCCVVIIYGLFCILILFSGETTRSAIYYASDNIYLEQYEYLVMVRTGGTRTTTVRVVLTIRSEQSSVTHVLNYPDPEYKIFQDGAEDWIVITTAKCLGDITSIVLRHDSSGIWPLWVCDSIVIYDMQTYEKWFFNINETISVYHRPIVIATPDSITPRLKGVLKERHSWYIFSEDINRSTTYILRLILLYSKLIVPLMFAVCCYCLSILEEIDDDEVYSEIDWFCFIMAIFGGFVSFVYHCMCSTSAKHILSIITPVAVIATTVVVVLGFLVPLYSSFLIISGWLIGIFLDVFLYENTQRLLKEHVYGTTKIAKNTAMNFSEIQNEVHVQRQFIYNKYGTGFIRYLEPLHTYSEPDKAKIKHLHVLKKQKLQGEVTELLIFGIYFILLYATVLIQRDTFVVYSHETMQTLIEGSFTKTSPRFSKLNDLVDINDYINNTLIDALHPDHWYGDFYIKNPGLTADFHSKCIGVARIQQHRVKEIPCIALSYAPSLVPNVTCHPEFSLENEERRIFDGGWDHPTDYIFFSKRLWKMWAFSPPEESGVYIGDFANYADGGYTVHLGRTKQNSRINTNLMKNTGWIDEQTRSVVIEFLTYNSNYNIFASVLLLMEISATGLVRTRSRVTPDRMLFVQDELEHTTAIITIMFVLWVGILVCNRTTVFLRKGFFALKNFWDVLDLLIILLSVTAIIIYIARINAIRMVLLAVGKMKHNEFVPYFHLFRMNEVMKLIGAVLVFSASVRLWKLLRFFKMFQIFENTLVIAAWPLLTFILYHCIINFAFSVMAYISFGETIHEFESVYKSSETLTSIYLSNFKGIDLHVLDKMGSSVGVSVMVVYMLLTRPIMQIYVVIEMFAYIDAIMICSEPEDTYSLIDYIKEKILFQFSVCKTTVKRLRGGELSRRKVQPKSNDILYANCVSTTTGTLKEMTFVTMVVLRNILQTTVQRLHLTEFENRLMLKICNHFIVQRRLGNNKEIFYKTYVPEHKPKKLKIIDSRRIIAARRIAEIILYKPSGEEVAKEELVHDYDAVLKRNQEFLEEARVELQKCLKVLNSIQLRRVH